MEISWLLPYTLVITDLLMMVGQVRSATERRSSNRRKGSHGPWPPKLNSARDLIDTLIEGEHYNKRDPPTSDRPTRVALGIYVNSFYSISEQTMDFSVSMYLRQSWSDPRLVFTPEKGQPTQVRLRDQLWDRIWVPDTFFRNEKAANFHHITVHNRLLRVNATGAVWYVSKISAVLACSMTLHRYPLDTQRCPIMFESFGYTMDTMYFAWLENAVEIEKGLELPQFNLKAWKKYDCSQNYTAGAFPCLQIDFILERDIGFFVIQLYVPTILIVILSWVAFWINVDAIPARVSLGLLTVLTMTTQSTGARSSLPRVSYIKAIDVWLSMCLIFVFASLLEFAVVNVISRKEVRTIKPVRRPPNQLHKDLDPEAQMNIMENGMDLREPAKIIDPEGKQKARKIDKMSRKVFPLAFLVFNVIYWIMYTLPITPEGSSEGKQEN